MTRFEGDLGVGPPDRLYRRAAFKEDRFLEVINELMHLIKSSRLIWRRAGHFGVMSQPKGQGQVKEAGLKTENYQHL